MLCFGLACCCFFFFLARAFLLFRNNRFVRWNSIKWKDFITTISSVRFYVPMAGDGWPRRTIAITKTNLSFIQNATTSTDLILEQAITDIRMWKRNFSGRELAVCTHFLSTDFEWRTTLKHFYGLCFHYTSLSDGLVITVPTTNKKRLSKMRAENLNFVLKCSNVFSQVR